MVAILDRLAAWRGRLGRRIQASEETLLLAIVSSAAMDPGELRGMLSVGDYRLLINDLGRALRLKPHTLSFCELVAGGIAGLQSGVIRSAKQLWRHGIGHAAYALVALLEPVILLRRGFVAIAWSRCSVQIELCVGRLLGELVVGLSNFSFECLVRVSVSPVVVTVVKWFHARMWPRLATVMRLLHSVVSIGTHLCRLAALNAHGLTALRVTIALARRRIHLRCASGRQTDDPEPQISTRVANAVLRREPVGLRSRNVGEELWVDIFPAGPLFATLEPTRIAVLWQRIDASSNIDRQTYEEILSSFENPAGEVLAALKRIARPPRPMLSAVIVATGLRMGLAAQLAKLRSADLQREISRWKFFSDASALPNTGPQKYVVLTPVNDYSHQKPRIVAGKLTARILEVVLGHGDRLSFHFVYALPACRPGTVPAEEREKLATLVRATIAITYLPECVRVTVLDDLYSDVWLPNLKGLPLILALRKVCSISSDADVLALSEMNDSASWLNIVHLAAALPEQCPTLITGRRPNIGAGKAVAGHATTRLFNCLFRFLIPKVTVRDSSSVLKVATVASLRAILDDLTCLDYAIDQDILAMMSLRGRVVEKPIQWYQTRGRWGHERSAGAQIASLISLSSKTRLKRRLATLDVSEWLLFDGGFDFQVFTDGRGRIRKVHARERNRLFLLLTSLRSILRPGTSEREGHREFARFIPLATRLISVVGQAPLKSVLRVAEGKYRDPLPAILEHLKYQTSAIVQTSFIWRPVIQTPIGPSDHYLFALEQPLATLGTLRSAIELNLRLGDVRAAADTLKVILNLQEALVAQGLVDPDLKSLLDCGIFIEDGLVTVKHLDFAGFLRDRYVIEAVLPCLFEKFVQMRDFRQIALLLGGTSVGRAHVIEFREDLERFVKSVPERLSSVSALPFSPDPHPWPIPQARDAQRDFVDDVIATAKFASHAPVTPRPEQILMRRAISQGSSRFIVDQPTVTFQPSGSATSMPEPMFVVASQTVADILESDMKEYLPDCRYQIVHVRTPGAIPLMRLVRDIGGQAGGAHVVMRVGGRSSRMRDLLGDGCPHKALMRVLGRPLFIHTLEGMRILATVYPDRIWLTNPDTVCIFGNRSEWPNVEAEVVAPLPIEAFRLFQVYERANSAAALKAEAVGKLFARCYLATRRGGYSLPPIIGMKRVVTRSLPDEVLLLGDFAQPDFWAYLSRVAALPERHRRRQIAAPLPQTWFDLDGPLELMALYRHALVPGFVRLLGGVCRVCPTTWENSVNIRSTVLMSGAGEKIRLRNCVFDNSNVVIERDPHLPQACIDGLVVANSNVSIRIGAPVVRDILIFGVTTAPGEALLLCLDGQAIAMSSTGLPCTLPLSLRAFTMPGQGNELLRCGPIGEHANEAIG